MNIDELFKVKQVYNEWEDFFMLFYFYKVEFVYVIIILNNHKHCNNNKKWCSSKIRTSWKQDMLKFIIYNRKQHCSQSFIKFVYNKCFWGLSML